MAWVGMKEGGLRPPPIIQLGPVNQTLVVGGQAELHCQTSAGREPAQVVTWLKEGLPLEFPATASAYLAVEEKAEGEENKQYLTLKKSTFRICFSDKGELQHCP